MTMTRGDPEKQIKHIHPEIQLGRFQHSQLSIILKACGQAQVWQIRLSLSKYSFPLHPPRGLGVGRVFLAPLMLDATS